MSESILSRYGVFARRPWLTLVIFIGMTVISIAGYKRPTLLRELLSRFTTTELRPTDNEVVPPRNAPPSRRGRDRAVETTSLFGSEVMLLVTAKEFFEPQQAQAIRDVVDSLEALPQVHSINWMENAPPLNIFGLPEPLLPDHRATANRFVQAKEKALSNPMVAGQFLSRDGQTMLLLLHMDWFHVRSDADCTTNLISHAESTLAKHPGAQMEFAITGEMPMRLRIGEKNAENDRKFQLIVYGGVLLMAGILFRGLSAVIIAALPVAVGVFWSFGCIRFLEMEDNPFNFVVVPILLSMVGFTDSVHIIAQIRARRSSGLSAKQAVSMALDDVGGACFLTSLTTAIGFASLYWAHHQVVQEFGICCVLGAGVMFVAVMTTIPLACRTWLGRGIQRGEIGGWIERNFYRYVPVVQAIMRRPVPVAIVAVGLTMITGIMTLQLQPDERAFNGIPEDSPEAVALRHMDRAFGGLETASVSIRFDTEQDVSNEQLLTIVQEVETLLKSEPMLGSPLGLASLVNALPGEGTVVQKASLVELLPPPLKQVFWQPTDNRAAVIFRLQDLGIASFGETFERIASALRSIESAHPGVQLTLEGRAISRWKDLYRIIVDLAKSLGTASLVIFAVLAVAYRSLRLGLIAVIPNLFPLTITGAVMWLMGQPLELVGVLAFTVCLGIAVDDTIHYMTRYREELKQSPDHQIVLERTTTGVGAAMVMTTVVLLAGFSTVTLSDSREHHIFAAMGSSTIAAAIIGDLVFLPALLAIFAKPRPTKKPPAEPMLPEAAAN